MRRRTLSAVLILCLLFPFFGCEPDANGSRRSIFVNDRLYLSYYGRPAGFGAELDESWVYLGEVQRLVRGFPTENFYSSLTPIGAKIYHSYEGRISVSAEEFYDDSIMVVFIGDDNRLWHVQYISEAAFERVNEILRELAQD
jgi:hypothetical protein